jgi:hypothetical protein
LQNIDCFDIIASRGDFMAFLQMDFRSRFYVCEVCGNIVRTSGDTVISCCGNTLPPLEAKEMVVLTVTLIQTMIIAFD